VANVMIDKRTRPCTLTEVHSVSRTRTTASSWVARQQSAAEDLLNLALRNIPGARLLSTGGPSTTYAFLNMMIAGNMAFSTTRPSLQRRRTRRAADAFSAPPLGG
jgi:hypothetical protein